MWPGKILIQPQSLAFPAPSGRLGCNMPPSRDHDQERVPGPRMATPISEVHPVAAPEADPAEYQFGRFRLSVPTRELRRDGVVVPVTAKTFDTLVVLVQHHGRVVTKDELMKAQRLDT